MMPRRARLPFLTFVFLALLLLPSRQGDGPFAMPPVHRIVLQNQLVLLFVEDHSLPFATVQLLVSAGSWRDPKGEAGLANLTAKSILLGTSEHSASEINEMMDFLGSSIDVSCDKDYATFTLRLLKKDFEKGIGLFFEAVTKPAFPADEIKREIVNTVGAIRSSEDQPSQVAEKAFQRALFPASPYGHPAMGTEESLAGIGAESVARFHQTYYHPNGAILAVVGDMTLDEVRSTLVPQIEKWPKGKVPESRFDEAFAEGPETVKIDRSISQANVIIGHRGVERQNKDYYALTVMNFILGGGDFSSRLLEEIRIKRGLTYFVGSSFIPRKHPGSFVVELQTKNESAREAISLVLKEMEQIRKEPVSEQELEVARKYLIGSFPLRFETQQGLAGFIVQVEFYGLGLDYPEKYPSLIEAVTREDVLRVARAYLHPDKCITVVVGNLKEAGME